MSSKSQTLALAAGLILLAGCVPSLHPLYTDAERTTESDLIGTWSQADSKDTWQFESGTDESYVLTYIEKGVPAKFRANLVQLGDHMFLDLYPAEETDVKNDLIKLHLIPAHTFARLRIKGDLIELTMMDNDWLRGKLKRKELNLSHEVLEDGVILTAPTKALQEFVVKFAADPQAFPKPAELKRVAE